MGFADRPYSGGSGGGGFNGGGGDLLWKIWRFFNLSFPVGTYFAVRVRVHITFFMLIAFELFAHESPMWTLRWLTLLFLSVLLHEFGHALSCRAVGGTADDILLWPLGGLAFCAPPHRPWPEFVTVIWGPLVNVIIACCCWAGLIVWVGFDSMPITLNPFEPYTLMRFYDLDPAGAMVADLFVVNYMLLLFNMCLVFYPFDGGRLVQIALWTKLGYARSLMIATTIGMIGAVGIVLWGLAVGHGMLVFIGGFGFYSCYQQRLYVRQVGPEYATEFGDMYEATKPSRPGMIARWTARRKAQKLDRIKRDADALDAEVDRVLDKVHREGIHALTAREKRTLQEATERQRR